MSSGDGTLLRVFSRRFNCLRCISSSLNALLLDCRASQYLIIAARAQVTDTAMGRQSPVICRPRIGALFPLIWRRISMRARRFTTRYVLRLGQFPIFFKGPGATHMKRWRSRSRCCHFAHAIQTSARRDDAMMSIAEMIVALRSKRSSCEVSPITMASIM